MSRRKFKIGAFVTRRQVWVSDEPRLIHSEISPTGFSNIWEHLTYRNTKCLPWGPTSWKFHIWMGHALMWTKRWPTDPPYPIALWVRKSAISRPILKIRRHLAHIRNQRDKLNKTVVKCWEESLKLAPMWPYDKFEYRTNQDSFILK